MSNIYVKQLIQRYPQLECCKDDIVETIKMLTISYKHNGKLLACGNGGSAADAEHIVGELMKGFLLNREINTSLQANIRETFPETGNYICENLQGTLSAISLVSQEALLTAFSNDKVADLCFAQQVLGYGQPGDILFAISTSGNSKNVIYAAQVAKAMGLKVVALLGGNGGNLMKYADRSITVPEKETFLVQELHLPIYHAICASLEQIFFKKDEN